jgi:hypothetical protein
MPPAAKIGRRATHLHPISDFHRRRTLTRCAGLEANRWRIRDRDFPCGKTRFFWGADWAADRSAEKPPAPALCGKNSLDLTLSARIDGRITALGDGQNVDAMVRIGLHLFSTVRLLRGPDSKNALAILDSTFYVEKLYNYFNTTI